MPRIFEIFFQGKSLITKDDFLKAISRAAKEENLIDFTSPSKYLFITSIINSV